MASAAIACRNCEAALAPQQRFCATCGQRVTTGRLTMRDIAHDLIHAFTHADHSIFALVKGLLLHPGRVAREYVEGRRKRYFGPFAFLVISVGVAAAAIYLSGVGWFKPISAAAVSGTLQKHVNLVILARVPLIAAVCALLFLRQRLNFAEHLVLAAYTSGVLALFLGLVDVPLIYLFDTSPGDPALAAIYYGAWFVYFGWAAQQFYRGSRLWAACKAVIAAIVSQLAIMYGVYLFFVVAEQFR